MILRMRINVIYYIIVILLFNHFQLTKSSDLKVCKNYKRTVVNTICCRNKCNSVTSNFNTCENITTTDKQHNFTNTFLPTTFPTVLPTSSPIISSTYTISISFVQLYYNLDISSYTNHPDSNAIVLSLINQLLNLNNYKIDITETADASVGVKASLFVLQNSNQRMTISFLLNITFSGDNSTIALMEDYTETKILSLTNTSTLMNKIITEALLTNNPLSQITKIETISINQKQIQQYLPSSEPTTSPTSVPTLSPSWSQSNEPTLVPSSEPTSSPTLVSSSLSSVQPTNVISSEFPTLIQTLEPSLPSRSDFTNFPTSEPTFLNTPIDPTNIPTFFPTVKPTSVYFPTISPVIITSYPTLSSGTNATAPTNGAFANSNVNSSSFFQGSMMYTIVAVAVFLIIASVLFYYYLRKKQIKDKNIDDTNNLKKVKDLDRSMSIDSIDSSNTDETHNDDIDNINTSHHFWDMNDNIDQEYDDEVSLNDIEGSLDYDSDERSQSHNNSDHDNKDYQLKIPNEFDELWFNAYPDEEKSFEYHSPIKYDDLLKHKYSLGTCSIDGKLNDLDQSQIIDQIETPTSSRAIHMNFSESKSEKSFHDVVLNNIN